MMMPDAGYRKGDTGYKILEIPQVSAGFRYRSPSVSRIHAVHPASGSGSKSELRQPGRYDSISLFFELMLVHSS
jgi:hypothetical protein